MGKIRVKDMQPLQCNSFEDNQNFYKNIFQSKATSMLTRIDKNTLEENSLTGVGSVTFDGIRITVNNCRENYITVQVNKFLDLLMLKLADQLPYGKDVNYETIFKKREVKITLQEYMEYRGLKSPSIARETVTNIIQVLQHTTLDWVEKRKVKINSKVKTEEIKRSLNIIEETTKPLNGVNAFKNNCITVTFGMKFALYLTTAFILPYDTRILKLNSKTSSYPFAKAILEHLNMNKGKPNQNIISVEALLKRTAKIPKYEDIASTGIIKRRIIQPFENSLNEIVDAGIIKEWIYTKSKGRYLTDEELGLSEDDDENPRKNSMKYQTFINSYIHFVPSDGYPKKKKRKTVKKEKE